MADGSLLLVGGWKLNPGQTGTGLWIMSLCPSSAAARTPAAPDGQKRSPETGLSDMTVEALLSPPEAVQPARPDPLGVCKPALPMHVKLHKRSVVAAFETGDQSIPRYGSEELEREALTKVHGQLSASFGLRSAGAEFDLDSVVSDLCNRVVQTLLVKPYQVSAGGAFTLMDGESIALLCLRAKKLFEEAPTVVEVKAPCKAFGDVHGQLGDLLELFKACANKSRFQPPARVAPTSGGSAPVAASGTVRAQVRLAESSEWGRQACQLRFHRRFRRPTVPCAGCAHLHCPTLRRNRLVRSAIVGPSGRAADSCTCVQRGTTPAPYTPGHRAIGGAAKSTDADWRGCETVCGSHSLEVVTLLLALKARTRH
jgi:hypothetical protein